ncbi:MAG TPA: DUF885 family protein [Candidatus Acidoferrales bacterium]|nr:DUF885 family protein [Candidatus Acidoferrales bacterium]
MTVDCVKVRPGAVRNVRASERNFASGVVCGFLVLLICCAAMIHAEEIKPQAQTQARTSELQQFAANFWNWRARYQPFSGDDIPRLEHPAGERDWSARSIAKQRAQLEEFEAQWKQLDRAGWTISEKVDDRLLGSALARVRWELDFNRRWERDPTFYLDQTLTALLEAVVEPAPFDAARSREIVARMQDMAKILSDGEANLHAVRPFAQLAINSLQQIRPELQEVEREVAPLLQRGALQSGNVSAEFQAATEKAIVALEAYRAWLQERLQTMPENAAVGRKNYEFFLSHVALIPYTPEQLLAISRQEWERAVTFEQLEKQRNQGVPELKIAANMDEQIRTSERDELAIRDFLEKKGILTVSPQIGHYTIRLMPGYVNALSGFGETDDFLHATGVRWANEPSPTLGYFWLATAKDPRPDMVHEGVPGHYFQMAWARMHEDPIRRHYYDSGPNEGLGFYVEEMMLQAGLFDGSPRSREIIYNFMRLRALRVEVDVKLALGLFTIGQAADYLAHYVPMDQKTAEEEAAGFAVGPGQAISYQIGKVQIMRFVADARLKQGDAFNLRAFDDYLWKNGNVPIVLLRWEYLRLDDDLHTVDTSATVAAAAGAK